MSGLMVGWMHARTNAHMQQIQVPFWQLCLAHCKWVPTKKKDCKDIYLSHNNPCFPCNIAITNSLVSHMLDKIT